MFMEERLNEILEIINKEKKVLVKDLSKRFNVSESMIRKDLHKLERKGKKDLWRCYTRKNHSS